MLIDGRGIPNNAVIDTEIAIVGGGIAGITLALEFSRWGIPACILEGGGTSFSARSQSLYAGEVTGLNYDLLSTRTRYLGGSSNCWSGWCRPFTEMDLAKRDWVPNSGWPVGMEAFVPYYARAKEMLHLADVPLDPQFWIENIREAGVRLLPFDTRFLSTVINHFSAPARVGKARRAELEASTSSKIMLHANVSEIITDEGVSHATGVQVRTSSGKNFFVKAKHIILAAGGIENARLLLLSNSRQQEGLGNAHDVVGRYFMDHPRIRLGRLTFKDPLAYSRFYDVTYHHNNRKFAINGTRAGATIGISEDLQREEKLLQCHTTLFGRYLGENWGAVEHCKRIYAIFKRHQHPHLEDFAWMVPGLPAAMAAFLTRSTRMRNLVQHYMLESILEPVPDPESRVTLSNQTDEFGLRRVRLTWRVGEHEKRTHKRAAELLKQQIEGQGIGRLELDAAAWDDKWMESVQSTWHHMGTTRMHANPRLGVVDQNCKMHGLSNLYIAGSSVFPTGGSNMPTINLVALAVRLAHHLKNLRRDFPPFELKSVSSSEKAAA